VEGAPGPRWGKLFETRWINDGRRRYHLVSVHKPILLRRMSRPHNPWTGRNSKQDGRRRGAKGEGSTERQQWKENQILFEDLGLALPCAMNANSMEGSGSTCLAYCLLPRLQLSHLAITRNLLLL